MLVFVFCCVCACVCFSVLFVLVCFSVLFVLVFVFLFCLCLCLFFCFVCKDLFFIVLSFCRVMVTAVDARNTDLNLVFFNNCFFDEYGDGRYMCPACSCTNLCLGCHHHGNKFFFPVNEWESPLE